jgi:arsenate reductase
MKLKIAFICVHNSCRSQMAEGFAKQLGSHLWDVYSAGTEKYHQVKPPAVQVMQEVGVDISQQAPKLLQDIPQDIDIVITMGCNVSCPAFPSRYREDWGLIDPSGKSLEKFRKTRDQIAAKMQHLIKRLQAGEIL